MQLDPLLFTPTIIISSNSSMIGYANDRDLIAIIFSQKMNNIIKLELRKVYPTQNRIKSALKKFCSCLGTWRSLCKIDLLNNRLGNKGCQFLTRAQLKKLKEISLSQNHIGSEGALHLSKSCWIRLEKLYLGSNNISLRGTEWLVRSKWNLKSLSFNWNKLQVEGMLGLLLAEWKLCYLTLGIKSQNWEV